MKKEAAESCESSVHIYRTPCRNICHYIILHTFDTPSKVYYIRYQKILCEVKGSDLVQLQTTSPDLCQPPESSLI
jgi:hypothetical protein